MLKVSRIAQSIAASCRRLAGLWAAALLVVLVSFVVASSVAAGERPAACANPPVTEAVPAELRELCAGYAVPMAPSLAGSPMDIAYGMDYVLGDPDLVQLARLRLGTPEVIQYLGMIDLPGDRILAACDYQGNDFSTLYCLDRENFVVDDNTNLYTVDTKTAELTYLASFPLTGVDEEEFLNGLTYDPTTGRMFGVSCDPFFGNTVTLYQLDLEALTLTQIGESSPPGLPCLRAVGADNDGLLWGLDSEMNGLQSIDKETGELTWVGPFGFDVALGQGMDFDASDNICYLFLFNTDTFRGELHRCDTATGHTKLVGLLGAGEQWGTGAIAAPSPCHVTLELSADEVQAGDPFTVRVGIVHNRAKTVSVRLALALEDASGNVVATRTAARIMKVGDHLDRALMLRVPRGLPPGPYRVTLDVDEMEQGKVRMSKMFSVVESPSDSVDEVSILGSP